jgi:hypothetical protein
MPEIVRFFNAFVADKAYYLSDCPVVFRLYLRSLDFFPLSLIYLGYFARHPCCSIPVSYMLRNSPPELAG